MPTWGPETPAKGATIGLNGNRGRHVVAVRVPGSGGPEGPPSRDGVLGLNGNRGRHVVAVRSGGPPCHSTSMPSMTRSMTPYSSAWVLGMER
jgi:hypothetical protein